MWLLVRARGVNFGLSRKTGGIYFKYLLLKMIIDFSQNINAFGAPKGLRGFVSKNSNLLLSYPSSQNEDVNLSIASFLGVNEKSVTYTNGSTEIFFSLPGFLANPKALIIQPTFWEYEVANKKAGIETKTFFLEESLSFKLNIEKLDKKITNGMAVFLCNPNNPTSTLVDRNKLLKLILKHKKTNFIIDETYLIFRHDYSKMTLTKKAQALKNLYVATSLSKIFALPGIRAGFLVSHPNNILLFIKSKMPYNTPSLSSAVTKWAITQTNYLAKTRKYYKDTRKEFVNLLESNFKGKLLIFKPQANFILARILGKYKSTNISKLLKEKGIIIRDGVELPYLGDKWIRFTIHKRAYNKKLVLELRKYFQ